MAAEVPVTDVLCEAMEYLSKLGLNLRTRSDNLREKKIRRDKLKTPQCIHKAAKKVLLICELSKRSLENVERGVRTILSTIDTTHTSSKFSENIKPIRDLERNSKYQQFKYQNYTMRICKSVPIKHYMSAKVHLKNMSLSMLDKYPVYYDCKLYRYRKKRKQKSSEHLDVSLDKQKTKKVHTDLDRHTLLKEGNDISKSLSEKSTNKVESWKNIDTANTSKSENDSEITDSQVMTKSQQDISKIKLNTLTDEQKQKDSSDAEPVQSEIPNKQEEIKSKPSCDSDSTTHEKNTVDETRSKKRKHVKMINDDSDDSEKDEPQFNDSEDSCDTQNNYESNNSKTSSKKRKMVESKTIDDSSSNNEEISIQTNNEKGDSKESTRPLIKCVNINKLLKPDIATNLKGTPESNKKSVKIIKCIGLIKMNASETPKIKSDRNLNKGSSYINEKKKAVLAFRPKKFTINVHKLPDFSKKLLHKLKLKRITYKGSVLCKIESDDVCEKYNFDKVKSNLLNDSDSNDNDEFPDRIGKKVKSIVIDESDSENKDNHKDTGQTKDYESSNVNTTEKESHIDDNDKNDLPVENTAENQGCKENNAFTDNNANSNSFREIPIENTVTQQFKDKSNMNEENTSTNSTTSENNSKSAKGNDKNLAKSDEDMNSKQTRDDNVFEGSPHTEYASKISSTNLISVNKEHYSKHPRIEEDSNKSSQQERESLKDTVRDETDSNTNIDKNVNPQSQNTVYNKRCEPKDIEKIKESLLTECDSDDDCLNTKFNNMDETVNKKDTTIDIEKCGIDSKVSKDETVKDRCSLQQNSGTTEDQSNEPGEKEKYDDNLEVMKDNHEHIETNIQDNHTNTKNNSVIQENPEKEESPSKIKSTLMNSSSESQSPDKKTTKVMKSRKKHIRDCMKAKKMLLTYSSSSEDELPRKKTFKGHKKSAVKQLSDELEDIKRNLLEQKKNIEGILCSSSSSEDSTKSIKLYYGRKTRVFNRSESEKDFEKNQDNFDSSSFKV